MVEIWLPLPCKRRLVFSGNEASFVALVLPFDSSFAWAELLPFLSLSQDLSDGLLSLFHDFISENKWQKMAYTRPKFSDVCYLLEALHFSRTVFRFNFSLQNQRANTSCLGAPCLSHEDQLCCSVRGAALERCR